MDVRRARPDELEALAAFAEPLQRRPTATSSPSAPTPPRSRPTCRPRTTTGPRCRPYDALFPGTHTPGHRLFASADEDHLRMVATEDGTPVGYVAIEHHPDGEAYIDFLGVAPEHRRRGIGRELIRAALLAGRDLGCPRAALTVREANAGARALYASLGFTEERVLRPLRKGFRLP